MGASRVKPGLHQEVIVRAPVVWAFFLAVLFAGSGAVLAQRPLGRPDLQGTWNGSTRTPLQRPQQFKDRATFTPEEAAEYLRATPDRVRGRLPTAADRQVQIDLDETYSEVERMPLDGLRTSPWRSVEGSTFTLQSGDRALQYRAIFRSDNGDRYSTLERVEVELR